MSVSDSVPDTVVDDDDALLNMFASVPSSAPGAAHAPIMMSVTPASPSVDDIPEFPDDVPDAPPSFDSDDEQLFPGLHRFFFVCNNTFCLIAYCRCTQCAAGQADVRTVHDGAGDCRGAAVRTHHNVSQLRIESKTLLDRSVCGCD